MNKGLLHHVEIYVSRLRESEEFLGWLLKEFGYYEYQRWDQGVSFRLGDTYLVFVQTEEKYMDVPYHRRRLELNHLAFYACSRVYVDELTEQLREKEIPILYEKSHPYAGGPDHYAVYFEDPDRSELPTT